MKKILNFITAIFSFLIVTPFHNLKNAGGNMDRVLNELKSSFNKMNFDGSFDKPADQSRFNLMVADVIGDIVEKGGVPMALGGGSSSVAEGLIASSKGDLNLTVERKSTNIDAKLPYALFGTNDFNAGYLSTLKAYLPAGVLVNVTTNQGKVVFTYTQGALVDVIEVAFTGISNYVAFLQSMNQTYFKCRYILYSISNVVNLSQFFEVISFGTITSLAMSQGNQLSPNSRKLPSDFQDDRVNLIFPEQNVNPDFSFVQNFGKFAMIINYDVYMSEKVSLNGRNG